MSYVAKKGSSDLRSNQSSSAHARSLSKTTCQVWQKFPHGLLLAWANYIGSGETARMRRLAWTFAVPICYNGCFPWRGSHICSYSQRIIPFEFVWNGFLEDFFPWPWTFILLLNIRLWYIYIRCNSSRHGLCMCGMMRKCIYDRSTHNRLESA